MKKVLCTLAVFGFLFAACEGPVGPQGSTGSTGPAGPAGATGAAGKDAATARFYDFELTWTSTSNKPISNYKLPKFDSSKEYILVFLNMDNLLFKPLPIKEDAAINANGVAKIVDMDFYYSYEGALTINEWNYASTGGGRYKFKAIVAPMAAGGRLSANTPYEIVKKKYNLPD